MLENIPLYYLWIFSYFQQMPLFHLQRIILILPIFRKVWWNGRSASDVSLLVIGITASMAFKLLVIFLFDNSTIFDCDVVPDVNNKILLLSSSILISSIASITFLNVVFSLVFNITSCTVNISS